MAVTTETKNVRVSVQEALSNMVEAYQSVETWADEGTIKAIEIVLEENINKVRVDSNIFTFYYVCLKICFPN
jgi:hypothetical protein